MEKQVEEPVKSVKINKNQVAKPAIATITLDANGKVLGRLSTEIAVILRGKDKPSFRYNVCSGSKVVVNNAAKIVLTGNKINQKSYHHHTGYLGHLKTVTAKELMAKNPADIIKRSVYGMLPNNKLKDTWMKNLTINN